MEVNKRSVFVFRHAEAMYLTEQEDPGIDQAADLTAYGREQAAVMGRWIDHRLNQAGFRGRVLFLASTFGRTLETALLASRELGSTVSLQVRAEPRLREDVSFEGPSDNYFARQLGALFQEQLREHPAEALVFITHDVVTEPVTRWLGLMSHGFERGTGVELVSFEEDLYFAEPHLLRASLQHRSELGLLTWLARYV